MSRRTPISRPTFLASALTLLPWCLPARAPAQQALDRPSAMERHRRGREETYRSMQESVSRMPPVAAKGVEDLFRLKVEGKDLALESPLSSKEEVVGSFRAEVPQFPGATSVTLDVTRFPRNWRAPVPMKVVGPGLNPVPDVGALEQHRSFSLVSHYMPDRDSLVSVNVVSNSGYLHVQRTVQSSDVSRTVQLLQQKLADGVMGPTMAPLTMSVNEYSFNFGRAPGEHRPALNLIFRAADFRTLLRQHPKEVEEHVRPMLRAVGQEAVLAPDDLVAWQVFADRRTPDPRVVEKVRAILPALDHADYRARERAMRELEALGKAGAAALIGIDRTGFSPERNLLIDRALAPFAQLKPKEAERLGTDTGFLLDCLNSGDAEIRAAALERLKLHAGADITFDPHAPAPARSAAVAALRQKLLPDPAAKATPTTRPAKS